MTTVISNHQVVKIRKLIKRHDTFSCYVFIATDKHGNDCEVTFFHTHIDPLTIGEIEVLDYRSDK